MNSKVFALSEPHYIDFHFKNNSICSCEEKSNDCPFWKKIIDKIENQGTSIDNFTTSKIGFHEKRNPFIKTLNYLLLYIYYFTGLNFRNSNFFIQFQNQAKLMRIVDELEEKEVYIDGSKSLIRALYLSKLLEKDFESRFLFLFRDPRANVYSKLKKSHGFILKNSEVRIPSNHKLTVKTATDVWMKYVSFMLRIKRIFKLSSVDIIFEDFVKNPEKIFKKHQFEFGLEWEDQMLNLDQKGHHMLGGNPSRVNAKRIVAPESEWQYLSQADLTFILQKTSKITRQIKQE
jgi:hypothetical protein